jgi:ribonucleoside-triphosphate reductase (thioredoxin)
MLQSRKKVLSYINIYGSRQLSSSPPALRRSYELGEDFISTYRKRAPPFGFNGLGELVYKRTYSRVKEEERGGEEKPGASLANARNEEWFETVRRVVEGTYGMQRRWIESHSLGWDDIRARDSAEEMYERIFSLKFLPPGRGLWAMGSSLTESERRPLFAALNNCAFVTTRELGLGSVAANVQPFTFLMDASMLGVGVGFDTRGAGQLAVPGVDASLQPSTFVVPDSREGWVASVGALLEAHLSGDRPPLRFDYALVRPAGAPIRRFGGVSSGPAPLEQLHADIDEVMSRERGSTLSVRGIVDLMNMIGRCVVSGNVRQTAEIAFGDADCDEFVDLKNYAMHPERAAYGWTSNNSVFARVGMDYAPVARRIEANGEPGFAWLDNMRRFSRMGDPPDMRDWRASGGNPCLEQTLESYELCCLVETFPFNHERYEDFERTLKFAFLYAKTVTLGATHWPDSNRVMLRNRRIGTSMSGIAQFVAARGVDELRTWADSGYAAVQRYDERFSEWLAIPRSIKTTSIKPSGTVSLLAGATPGMHHPIAPHYIRRVRLPATSSLIAPLRAAGYRIEPAVGDAARTAVVEIPVHVGDSVRSASELSIWEQLSLAALLQRHWADNQVSCTVTFEPGTESSQIPHALDYFQSQLKGVAFLPNDPNAYPQMPYEAIDADTYAKRVAELGPIDWSLTPHAEHPDYDQFCESDRCTLPHLREQQMKLQD